jgi:hypothetical protein
MYPQLYSTKPHQFSSSPREYLQHDIGCTSFDEIWCQISTMVYIVPAESAPKISRQIKFLPYLLYDHPDPAQETTNTNARAQ